MSSREHYTVTANSLPELVTSLNFTLARVADRLDKQEGVRGNPTFESDIDLQANKITDAGKGSAATDGVTVNQISDQDLNTSDGPTFASMTVTGDAIVGDDLSVVGSMFVKDDNGTIIHQFGVES